MRSAPRRRRDRGAVLIEIAFVVPVLLFILAGAFEYGLLFRDTLTAGDAVSDAARIGAIVGPDTTADGRSADFEVIRTVREGLSALGDQQIDYIVVFRAANTGDAPEDQLTTQCRNGISVNTLCNAYDAAEAFAAVEAADTGYFKCAGSETAACAWDPKSRRDGPSVDQIETLGVYVKLERDGITSLFADSFTITRAAIARLEPGLIQS